MKISTKGRYALRMMVDLATHDNGEYISLRDISTRQAVSMKYMEQIVSQLTKSHLLYSVRGPQGGYKLARKPVEYTVGEILRVTEGSLAPVSCLDTLTNHCQRAPICSTISMWEELNLIIGRYLDSVSLLDLADRERERVEAVPVRE